MSEVLAWLGLLELLRSGQGPQVGPPGPPGDPGTPAPVATPVAPATPAATPAPVHMPPPGDIGPPPAATPIPAVTPAPTAPPVSPGALPPMPPWPSPPTPGTLPPFPGPGWCPDTPVTAAVAQRAAYWNPQLWDYPSKTIRKAFVQEQFGGSWVTFKAAWHPGSAGPQTYMATEAYRVCTAPPVAPPTPAPATPPPVAPMPVPSPAAPMAKPGPVGPEPGAGAWQTNSAFIKRYQAALTWIAQAFNVPAFDPKGIDGKFGPNTSMAVKAFQVAHGLSPVDGEVGSVTSSALDTAMGYTAAPVPSPGSPAPAPAAPPPSPAAYSGPPPRVLPYPGTGAWQTNAAYIARYQAALTWLGYDTQGTDGKYGPHTMAAVKAFQSAHGLTPDGQAGAATAAAIDAAVAAHG